MGWDVATCCVTAGRLFFFCCMMLLRELLAGLGMRGVATVSRTSSLFSFLLGSRFFRNRGRPMHGIFGWNWPMRGEKEVGLGY